jgi:hypothetical protein
MISIDAGRVMQKSDEQFKNADSPRRQMRQSRSKVTLKRFPHFEKQNLEILTIDEGIQID